jgi:hypothetical protein
MYLLLGNFQMERSDYEGAIQSFEHARAQMRHNEGRSLLVVSLVGPLMNVLQRFEWLTNSDRYLNGNLMISTSRFDSVCVTHCIRRVARKMRSSVSTK